MNRDSKPVIPLVQFSVNDIGALNGPEVRHFLSEERTKRMVELDLVDSQRGFKTYFA
jgi:hypothetical protein